MKRTPSPYFTPAKTAWMEYYQQTKGETYYFTGIDGRHLTQLIAKIKMKVIDQSMEPTVENVTNSFAMFLRSIKKPWILENLELKNVNSNWNSLYVHAKENSPLGRSESIDEIIRRRHSERASGGAGY